MTILMAWLLADFLSGLFHWWEDRYLNKITRFEFLNRIKHDNDQHHKFPQLMLKYSYWETIKYSAIIAWPLTALLVAIEAPHVVWLTIFFMSFGNLIHRFAHTPKQKLNRFVRTLQSTGLFASFDHHKVHHFNANGLVTKSQAKVRFCPMSNWVNPTLDKIRFFPCLEQIFKRDTN